MPFLSTRVVFHTGLIQKGMIILSSYSQTQKTLRKLSKMGIKNNIFFLLDKS